MTPKEFFKLIIPPLFVHAYRSLRIKLNRTDIGGLSGDYRTWDEAVQASTGYDSKIILDRTKEALLKVKNGQAVYERDSVLFDEIQYAWPILAGLMWVAAKSSGKLNVLDFGGSLGSTYFQNLAFLDSIPEVHWNIVEQPRHVEVGMEFFEDGSLKFFSSIKDCVAASQPNVVILSSVLHYLERPYDVLGELMEMDCEHIIIDRTPFWNGNEDRLCIQHVNPIIYEASIPLWVFSMEKFRSFLLANYSIMVEFDSFEQMKDVYFKGFLLNFNREA